jgi:flagellar biosynthesis activator protein FlaF
MSIQAYQRTVAQAEPPRDTEYRVFGAVTSNLMRAQERGRADLRALNEALDQNRRLWTTLAQDCAQSGNALPEQVRAGVISLSLWVSRHSSAVMREGGDIGPLIDVNRMMMEGLATR